MYPSDYYYLNLLDGIDYVEVGSINANTIKIDELLHELEIGKVDAVEGKGLSSNDYTTADKNKVALILTNQGTTKYLRGDGTYQFIGWDTITDKPSAYVPTSHTSTLTTYGAGSASYYGHVKLSDSTSSTSGTSGGVAATPAAVKSAIDRAAAKQRTTTLTVGISGRSYGAISVDYWCTSGSTASQINAAILACNNTGGGRVMLLEGTYNIESNITMRDNVTLAGQGMGSRIVIDTSRRIDLNGLSWANINNLHLSGASRMVGPSIAIQLTNSAAVIHDCYIQGFVTAISIDGKKHNEITEVRDCYIRECGYNGGYGIKLAGYQGAIITNNKLYDCRTGIGLTGGADRNIIQGNCVNMKATNNAAIHLTTSSYCAISNNVIMHENADTTQIDKPVTWDGYSLYIAGQQNIVQGNTSFGKAPVNEGTSNDVKDNKY